MTRTQIIVRRFGERLVMRFPGCGALRLVLHLSKEEGNPF